MPTRETHFTVNIIPHTAARPRSAKSGPGRQLNVEIDVLARYLDRMIAAAHSRNIIVPSFRHIVM